MRTTAKIYEPNDTNLKVSKALPLARSRPTKNEGKRKKRFYERGLDAKKMRSYSFSLWRREDQNSDNFSLKRSFHNSFCQHLTSFCHP